MHPPFFFCNEQVHVKRFTSCTPLHPLPFPCHISTWLGWWHEPTDRPSPAEDPWYKCTSIPRQQATVVGFRSMEMDIATSLVPLAPTRTTTTSPCLVRSHTKLQSTVWRWTRHERHPKHLHTRQKHRAARARRNGGPRRPCVPLSNPTSIRTTNNDGRRSPRWCSWVTKSFCKAIPRGTP